MPRSYTPPLSEEGLARYFDPARGWTWNASVLLWIGDRVDPLTLILKNDMEHIIVRDMQVEVLQDQMRKLRLDHADRMEESKVCRR